MFIRWCLVLLLIPTLANAQTLIDDNQLKSPYSGVGSCGPGQFVNSLTRNSAPGCAPASGGASVLPLSPLSFGAHCNVRTVNDLSITNGSSQITSASANFTSADVNDDIIVVFPNGAPSGANQFTGCIQSVVNPTTANIGTWSGSTCTQGNYGGATRANASASFGQDDLAGLTATVAQFHGGNSNFPVGQIKMPNATCIIKNTWLLTGVSGDIGGFGSEGSCTQTSAANNASCIMWAGPSGVPVVEFQSTRNLYIHDVAIWGNSNAANMPSATLNVHENFNLGAASKNGGWNLTLGDTCNSEPTYCDQGNFNGTVNTTSLGQVQGNGLLIDGPNQNNDKNWFQNIRVGEASNCLTITNNTNTEGDQSVENYVQGLRCFATVIGLNAPFGGAATLVNPEFLDSDLEYNIGGPGLFHVIDTNDEMDTNFPGGVQGLVRFRNGGWLILDGGSFDNTSVMPSSYVGVDYPDHGPLQDWVANTNYANGSVIQPPLAKNQGLFEFQQSSGAGCASGGSVPLWSSVQTIGNTISDNSCIWTTTYTGDNNTSSMLVMENGFHIVESGVLPPAQPLSFDMNPVNAGGTGKDALYANGVLASVDMASTQIVNSAINVSAAYLSKYVFNSAYFGTSKGEDTKCTNSAGTNTCSSFPPPGPPTLNGSAVTASSSGCSGAGPSATITVGTNDTLYAIIAAAGTVLNPTYAQTAFSDNNGGSWVRVDRGANPLMCPTDTPSSNSVVCMYKSTKHPSGPTTVSSTINAAGSGTCENKLVVVDVAGIGSPVFDQSHGASGSSSAVDSGATAALATKVEFCLGAGGSFQNNASPSSGPTGGFTTLANVLGATETLWSGYNIVTNGTGNTQDVSWTAGGSVPWGALISCDEQSPQP